MCTTLLTTTQFSVERRSFTRPDGRTIQRDVVVHPGAVVVLPILDDRRIIMIRNYRYTVRRELLELPAGTIEPGEEPAGTARRELEEETGYRAADLRPLTSFYTSPGIVNERMYAFAAHDLSYVGQNLQGAECISTEIVDLDQVRNMLLEGTLLDGKTIAVLGRYLLEQSA